MFVYNIILAIQLSLAEIAKISMQLNCTGLKYIVFVYNIIYIRTCISSLIWTSRDSNLVRSQIVFKPVEELVNLTRVVDYDICMVTVTMATGCYIMTTHISITRVNCIPRKSLHNKRSHVLF